MTIHSPLSLTLFLLVLALSLFAATHAVLHKRDPRAALIWLGLCLGLPGLGAFLYWLLGVNRIRTHARRLHHRGRWQHGTPTDRKSWVRLGRKGPPSPKQYGPLLGLSDGITRRPLLPGNQIKLLVNGEAAYPAMLKAMESARRTLYLSSYIFDSDRTGMSFVKALAAAKARGVKVRVLVDGVGEKYSPRPITRVLRDLGISAALFLPVGWRPSRLHFNLRNHRKLLVVDNRVGFLGGMNIRDSHWVADNADPKRVQDIHFRVEGPAVYEMQEVFLEDWYFTTKESLPWSGPAHRTYPGGATARVISDGPNEEIEKVQHLLLGILAWSRKSVRLMTPYFIPDRVLMAGLQNAALRGVEVELFLPVHNNLPLVGWASRAYLWELIQRGVRVYDQPAPFAHSKALVADGAYSLVGSSNLDTRSLRLNFECDLEVYDRAFAGTLEGHFDRVRAVSKRLTLEHLNREPLPGRIRNAACKLFSPFL